MATLTEQLAQLSNPAPTFRDPEEDSDDDTRAKLTEKPLSGNQDDDGELEHSTQIRRQAAALLADSDSRYAGKKTSRQRLKQQFDDSPETDPDKEDEKDSSEEGSDFESSEADGEGEDGNLDKSDVEEEEDEDDLAAFKSQLQLQDHAAEKQFTFKEDGDYSRYAEDDFDDEESEAASDDDMEDSDDGDDDDEEEEEEKQHTAETDDMTESGMQSFSKMDLEEEVEKGKATQAQLGLWDTLLEQRIKLQKVLLTANQLPQAAAANTFLSQGGDAYRHTLKEGHSCLKTLLGQLLQLQTSLLQQHPETKHIADGDSPREKKSGQPDTADDEEISSDSDSESQARHEQEQEKRSQTRKRNLKMAEYPDFLAKRHTDFQPYRDNTIQKWYDKTRMSSGRVSSKSFGAFDQSALKQISQILSDKDRVIKRTQLKRSAYQVLGKPPSETTDLQVDRSTKAGETLPERDHLKDYDPEIFDDDDFYHQLLRELIERKTSGVNDPIALSRQWLEIQKLRNKVKKKVDTKASKGRKVRYDVHPKLVNFMASSDDSQWTDEAKNELFSSLFGKRHQVALSDTSDR